MAKLAARTGPGESPVAQAAEFTIGASASCRDGFCGEVCRVIVNPATDVVTHLVVRRGHRREGERLVPVDLVDDVGTTGSIRLRCTLAEFDQLGHAEERELVEGMEGVGTGGFLGDQMDYEVGGEVYAVGAAGELIGVGPLPEHRKTMVQDVVPLGETELKPGDRVHAVDGEIGRVQGFLVDPRDDRVTHVLLQEGHFWGRKEVAIPISAVTWVDDGIRLNITKEQVQNLPMAD